MPCLQRAVVTKVYKKALFFMQMSLMIVMLKKIYVSNIATEK